MYTDAQSGGTIPEAAARLQMPSLSNYWQSDVAQP